MTERVLASILVFLIALTASGTPIINRDFQAGGGGGGGGGGPYSFTFVGSAYGAVDTSSATVATTTGSIAVQVGDLILAAVQWEDDSTAEVTGIVDDNSTNDLPTKHSEVHNTGGEMNLHVWWGIADTARTVSDFEATIDTSLPYKKITVMVYRPSGGTVSTDISGTPANFDDTNTNQIPTSGTFSVAGNDSVVCGIAGIYTSGTWTGMEIGGVAADRSEDNSGQAVWCFDNAGPLTSVVAESTYSTVRYWVATAIAFKAE